MKKWGAISATPQIIFLLTPLDDEKEGTTLLDTETIHKKASHSFKHCLISKLKNTIFPTLQGKKGNNHPKHSKLSFFQAHWMIKKKNIGRHIDIPLKNY